MYKRVFFNVKMPLAEVKRKKETEKTPPLYYSTFKMFAVKSFCCDQLRIVKSN